MDALWDSDTGKVTVTATLASTGAAVNLSGTTAQHVIVRHLGTRVVTELAIDGTATNLVNGSVVGTATSLGAGTYEAILRVVDPVAGTVTYPSAEVDPPHFTVKADIDAA